MRVSQRLASQVSALEHVVGATTLPAEISAPPPAADVPPAAPTAAPRTTAREEVTKLLSGVEALIAEAETHAAPGGDAPAPPRPVPYISVGDDKSAVSWSADAFGKSKNPGFYHQHRKEIAAKRREMAMNEPQGTYTSNSKYADEAGRIKDTGRLAF